MGGLTATGTSAKFHLSHPCYLCAKTKVCTWQHSYVLMPIDSNAHGTCGIGGYVYASNRWPWSLYTCRCVCIHVEHESGLWYTWLCFAGHPEKMSDGHDHCIHVGACAYASSRTWEWSMIHGLALALLVKSLQKRCQMIFPSVHQ